MTEMLKNNQVDKAVRIGIASGMGIIIKARSETQINPAMRGKEQQKLQRERALFQRQLSEAQQALSQTQEQLSNEQQEHNRAQEQLRTKQLEHYRTQAQLRNVQQKYIRALEQIRQAQQESNQRGQSSRAELRRANDALPTTREGLQEQFESERSTPQESRERVQQLRERIQRSIWEQEDQPANERLNALLKYPLEGVFEDHQLVEQIYPHRDQPAQDQQALQQSLHQALRKRLKDLYLKTLVEYTTPGLQEHEIAGEFLNQFEEQIERYNRPSQEWVDVSEDIQQEFAGRRPRR
jgi:hypothetical protein